MPYPITSLAIAQVAFEGRHDNQQTITVMNYQYTDAGNLVDGRFVLSSLLAQLTTAGELLTKYRECVSEDLQDIRAYIQLVYPQRFAYVASPIGPQIGSIAGPCLPANIAQVVTRRGQIADKRNISSLHLPAVPTARVLDSRLTAPQMTTLQAFADKSCESISTIPTGNWSPIAYRRVAPQLGRILEEGFPQNTVRILRRRTVGLGT